ncbi:MAG: CBS domain-containing protein [Gammaproteobacteria bacterium]|nr:CBS domain-containing protein [Gammaproteobacteria bacterium]
MNDERINTLEDTDKEQKTQRSWLDRLSQFLQIEPRDRAQLVELLREARGNDVIDFDSLAMIEGVLQVSEMQVRDIMVPRSQMVVVERDMSLQDILPLVVDSQHSRFPAIGEGRDEVIGILLAKDLLPYFRGDDEAKFNLREILRPAVFIPESKRLNVLLKEFRSSRNHIAMVVDEYGGVAGLVTIEDVLEQIVGEIADEHDFEDEIYIMEHSGSDATIKAITPIEEFNRHFSTQFSDEEYDTVGGLIMSSLGHLPKRGEVVELSGFQFRILRADSRRIYLLRVKRRAPSELIEDGGMTDRVE